MSYDPDDVIRSYEKNAEIEDQAEKDLSLRTEIPREFIRRHLKPTDRVLDAGGGTGINAIMMAKLCEAVTLLDITPRIRELAHVNIKGEGLQDRVEIVAGDICDLSQFDDEHFSFIVCVGDALSYVLDQRSKAISELVRVAKRESTLLLGCDSKYGFLRLRLAEGKYEEALEILEKSETFCGMGPRTHLYTVEEMKSLLEENGCRLLKVASTPSISDTFDIATYIEINKWDKLKDLELEICTRPELLGTGQHLLFVAEKN